MFAFILSTLLVVLVVINTRMLKRINQSNALPSEKRTFKIALWAPPFLGASAVNRALPPIPSRDRLITDELIESTIQESAPISVQVDGIGVLNLLEHLQFVNGFPLPYWPAIEEWAKQAKTPEQTRAALDACKRAWLLHLRDSLPTGFRMIETQHASVLSMMDDHVALAAARYMLNTQRRIAKVLHGIVEPDSTERLILLVLPDQDLYYRYVSCYYPEEGEFAYSGGMFVNAGCGHLITHTEELHQLEPVLVHEMTHSALSSLQLPVWLDEGLAVSTERRLTSGGSPQFTPVELHRKHLRFWGEAEIQEFWSGRSFHRPDDGNLLSYELARILVESFAQEWPAFVAFVQEAKQKDAGAESARKHLSVDLGLCIGGMLDKDHLHWGPEPTLWHDGYGKTH